MNKRALIISDSHGKNDDVKAVIEQAGHIDMLIHLGDIERGPEYIRSLVDCPVHMVAGNNDYNIHLPASESFVFEGYKIFIVHGHQFYVNAGIERLETYAIAHGYDVAMYGHTHIPHLHQGDQVTVLNPGSLSYPRQEGREHTFMIMQTDQENQLHFSMGKLKSSLRDIYKGFY